MLRLFVPVNNFSVMLVVFMISRMPFIFKKDIHYRNKWFKIISNIKIYHGF